MHVLLVTAGTEEEPPRDAAPHRPRPPDRTSRPRPALADAWLRGAPRCHVDRVVLAAGRAGGPARPGRTEPEPVFVPTSALGLTSVGTAPEHPEAALLHARTEQADLVVVHVATLDGAGLHEGPVARAAGAAAPHAVPVVVLAGRSEVTRRELATAGVAGVHEVGEPWDPGAVERAARTWAPSWHAPG